MFPRLARGGKFCSGNICYIRETRIDSGFFFFQKQFISPENVSPFAPLGIEHLLPIFQYTHRTGYTS